MYEIDPGLEPINAKTVLPSNHMTLLEPIHSGYYIDPSSQARDRALLGE